MLTLDADKLSRVLIPVSAGWLLGACMEARGKQDLWLRQKPEVLEVLREQAIIQSAESSNRIEGVIVGQDRVRPLLIGKARPRDRAEEELAGYRNALDWIFTRKRVTPVSARVILHLHTLAQGRSSGHAGHWKNKDNEIIEILPDGERKLRFKPTSARRTPAMVEKLCANYREVCGSPDIPTLLAVATFVFDFLCIHPFRDGNGRVARLLTTLLLVGHGFQVGRYVSLERIVEESKEGYYRTLAACSKGWHEGTNEIVPWWNYFLGVLHRAYREFERQVENAEARPAKSDLVRRAVLAQVGPFTLADLAAQFPAASRQLIKKVLQQMKDAGEVRLTGKGRGARWEVSETR